MTAEPVLYSFRRCPYAIRARLALLVSGAVCEVREVKLRDKPAEMVAASPKATVPVLVLADGQVIDQSLDIMRWALGRHDLEHWLDGDDVALIEANDGPFKHHLDRYKYPDRYPADDVDHRAACLALLEIVERRLTVNAYLCGPSRSLTDAAILPFVRQFAAVERDWFAAQPLPALQTWLRDQLASPLFQRAMVVRSQWRAGDTPSHL